MSSLPAAALAAPVVQIEAIAAASGSVIGRDHARVGRNNQDGCAVARDGGLVVGVVTDGCGSQPSSEVGARLGADFLASWVLREVRQRGLADASLPERSLGALVHWLRRTAQEVGQGASLAATLERSFLFTFLCAVQGLDRALVFGVGDGVVWVDGQGVVLDAGEDNAPDYAAYDVLEPGRVRLVTHFEGVARTLAIGTDGLGPALTAEPAVLGRLLAGPRVFDNPAALQRALVVLGQTARLGDDATLVALRKGGAA